MFESYLRQLIPLHGNVFTDRVASKCTTRSGSVVLSSFWSISPLTLVSRFICVPRNRGSTHFPDWNDNSLFARPPVVDCCIFLSTTALAYRLDISIPGLWLSENHNPHTHGADLNIPAVKAVNLRIWPIFSRIIDGELQFLSPGSVILDINTPGACGRLGGHWPGCILRYSRVFCPCELESYPNISLSVYVLLGGNYLPTPWGY